MTGDFNVVISDLVEHWKLILNDGYEYEDYYRPIYLSPPTYAEAKALFGTCCICLTCGKTWHLGPCYDVEKWMQDEIKPLSNWKSLVFGGKQ